MTIDNAILKLSNVILNNKGVVDKSTADAFTMAVEAMEKVKLVKPCRLIDNRDNTYFRCSKCNKLVFNWQHYCENCGQPLDWGK